jgi:CRISPR-associated protein Cmr2
MTFSAGVAIAHYKTPLSEVLTWARKMEKEAKDTDNKDSFGIAVLKKSGEIHKAVLPFRETQTSYFSEKMRTIVASLNGKFSNKFIKSFEQETYLITDSPNERKLNDDILDILEFETSRLIKRAKIDATDTELSNLQNSVNSILKSSNKAKKALSFDTPIQNFTSSLNICDFINRKLQGND